MPAGVISSAGFEVLSFTAQAFHSLGHTLRFRRGLGGPVSMWAQDSGLGFSGLGGIRIPKITIHCSVFCGLAHTLRFCRGLGGPGFGWAQVLGLGFRGLGFGV